jgi:hypothetical protein
MLMVVVGVVRAVGGEVIGGVWFALIGLFLHQAARTSYALVRIRARLSALPAGQLMNTSPLVLERLGQPAGDDGIVSPRDSAWIAFMKIARNGHGRVVVVDNGVPVGVIRQQDLHDVVTDADRETRVARRAA